MYFVCAIMSLNRVWCWVRICVSHCNKISSSKV